MLEVIGETLIDEVVQPDGGMVAHPGGSPMNVAVGLSRLGHPTSFVGQWAPDEYGALITEHLRANNVATPLAEQTQGKQTSIARATLAEDGSASYSFDLEWDLGSARAELADITRDAEIVHTGSIATMLTPGAQDVLATIQAARAHALISYDPNYRPSIVTDPAQAREWAERFVALADIVKASDEDLEQLYPERSVEDSARAWAAAGPALVVVTRGVEGPWAVCSGGETSVPAPRVSVADTVGAGDSFMSALLASLVQEGIRGAAGRDALRSLSADRVRALLAQSAQAAAITVSRAGANPPYAREVEWAREAEPSS